MRVLTLFGVSIISALLLASVAPTAQGCNPVGNAQFVCGQTGPEDLAIVPGGEWVIASGNRVNGTIRLISIRDKTTTVLFPTEPPRLRPDTKTYNACPGPIDVSTKEAREKFRSHGLYLKPGRNSVHTLYTVHHGTRESVEVFEFDARTKAPTLTWVGCAVAPDPIGMNAVVALPDEGFVVTNFMSRPGVITKVMTGESLGELWEWHSGTGWKKVPGSESPGPNGLEISKDGKWFYIGAWGSKALVRLSHGQTPVKRDTAPVGFRIDNVRWAPDGSLLLGGHSGLPTEGPSQASVVGKIDPNTLKFQELVRYPNNEVFSTGTVAVQIGNELWVGSNGDRIATFPASPSPGR